LKLLSLLYLFILLAKCVFAFIFNLYFCDLQPASERTISKVAGNSKAQEEAILQEDAVIPSTSTESPQPQISQKPSTSRWVGAQQKLTRFLPKKITQKPKESIDNQLSLLFIMDFQPFRVVEDTGFQQFVSALNPAYALPSSHTILFRRCMKNVFIK
jgi:hypothetical protein